METPTENQESAKPVIVDPEKFGLTIKKGSEIEVTFSPLKTEYDALLKVYELIVNSEITPEVCERAKRCRIDAGKQIKKVSDVHKVEKAVFWNGGLFVDAIKNRDTLLLELIKNGAKKIEDTYHIIELERIEKVRIKRTKELSKYTTEIPESLGAMRLQIYDNFLAGAIAIYEAKIADEKKEGEERIAAEKLQRLYKERCNKLLIAGFSLDERGVYSIGNLEPMDNETFMGLSDKDFSDVVEAGKKELDRIEKELEIQRLELERMKKEAIEKERLAKIESDERAKVEADRLAEARKRDDELKPYLAFIRDYSKVIKLPEEEYWNELSEIKSTANIHWTREREKELERKIIEEERQQEKQHQQDILDKELVEKRLLKSELQAKKDAEDKIIADELKQKEAELSKGDADKINDLISDLDVLMTKYTFKSKKSQAKYLGVIKLISKVIKYIEE